MVWYSHLFHNFPQFILIHTAKGFGIFNKAEIDACLELSCFFDDPADVGNLVSGSSAFSKTSLNIWKFMVPVLLKPGFSVQTLNWGLWELVLRLEVKPRSPALGADFYSLDHRKVPKWLNGFGKKRHRVWHLRAWREPSGALTVKEQPQTPPAAGWEAFRSISLSGRSVGRCYVSHCNLKGTLLKPHH